MVSESRIKKKIFSPVKYDFPLCCDLVLTIGDDEQRLETAEARCAGARGRKKIRPSREQLLPGPYRALSIIWRILPLAQHVQSYTCVHSREIPQVATVQPRVYQ